MNCEKGDIALVKPTLEKANHLLQDKIVKTLAYRARPDMLGSGTDWWLCECNVMLPSGPSAPGEIDGERLEIPDSWLRPLRDNPGTDESLLWAPVPSKLKEKA